MKIKRTFYIAACSAVLAILTTVGIVHNFQKVEAFNPQPDPPGFGMLGITHGQTIRISVVNTAPPVAVDSPPDPCRATVFFRDVNGGVIQNANGQPIRRIVLLRGGQSTFLDLDADDFIRETGGQRFQIHPDVRIQQASGTGGSPPDPCIGSAEVFNNANGRTQLTVAALTQTPRVSTPQ